MTEETGYDIFEKDSIMCIPKLQITYRNNSNINYYFLKISDSRNGLPMMPYAGSLHPSDFKEYLQWRDDYFGRAKSHISYTNRNFLVRIGGMPLYSSGWYVHSDTLDYNNEEGIEIEFINSDLADIYEYIYRSNNYEYIEKKTYFSPLDVTPESILDTVKDQFVFLKPNEIYTDTYNLIGFKIVEGCFTFIINQNSFSNYVLIAPVWDNNQSCWVDQKMELPDKVSNYTLYSGDFISNKTEICFDAKSR
jgi:hypothetical protein